MNAKADTGAACITPEDHGARLDAALARLLPQLLDQLAQLALLAQLAQLAPSTDGTPPASPLLSLGAGLRARRRLWLTHAVLLDGRPAQPGTRVRAGQRVEVRPLHAARGNAPSTPANVGPSAGPDSLHDTTPSLSPDIAPHMVPNIPPDAARGSATPGRYPPGNVSDMPHVLAEADGLVALYKPGGLHSAAIAGSAAPNVEALLPALLGESALADRAGRAGLAGEPELADLADLAASDASRPMPGAEGATGFPRLLNRLDGPTSGILLAARTPQAADLFHAAENSGQATKTYLALVHGVLHGPATMRRALDTANRATTRVLPQDTPDTLRHTGVTPLGVMQAEERAEGTSDVGDTARHDTAMPVAPGTPCTLVRCVIRKGARHQIRAHLAALGHPIVGDTRYGTPDGTGTTAPMPPPMPPDAPRTACPLAPATLFLHHARIELPGFRAACAPPWLHLLPPELQEAARTAYRLDS